jgi:hypothetical protein
MNQAHARVASMTNFVPPILRNTTQTLHRRLFISVFFAPIGAYSIEEGELYTRWDTHLFFQSDSRSDVSKEEFFA